jgi:hypothetical protein
MIYQPNSYYVYIFCLLFLIACSKKQEVEVRDVVLNENNDGKDVSLETELFSLLSPETTGINFANALMEDNNQNYRSFAYMYNGSGVAIGDINNDGLQDILFGANQLFCRLYLNQGNFKFKDITESAGLNYTQAYKTGVNMVDINGDGFLDIYVCISGFYEDKYRKNLLYINNGNSTFTESAEKYGLADMSYSTQSYFFDYDNDGDLDMYLLNHPLSPKESNNLKAKNGKDGELEAALSSNLEFVTDKLFENTGNKFINVTEKSGIVNEAFGLSALVGDFNDDNFLDIYVCNDYVKPDYLYINNGNGTFSEKFSEYFNHTSFSSMGSDYADINNDGCIDLMTLDMFPEDNERQKMHGSEYNYDKYLLTKKFGFASQFIKNTLQINNCDGSFSDIGMMTGMAHTDWSWSVLMADYNNDGRKDVFVTNGFRRSTTDNDYVRYIQDSIFKVTPKNELNFAKFMGSIPVHKTKSYFFMNKGNLNFADVSKVWDPSPAEFSNGAAYADLDNDGYLDLVINNIDATPFILKNNGAQSRKNNFVRFDLKNESGKSAYGAKVEIIDNNDNLQVFHYYPAKGFLSSVERFAHFGLGTANTIKSAKVYWPQGKTQILRDIKVNTVNIVNYSDQSKNTKKLVNPSFYFEPNNAMIKPDMVHIENEYIDFKREPLLHRKYSNEGPAACSGDINGDGLDDIFLGGATGLAGKIYLQKENGQFQKVENPDLESDKIYEDVASIFADFDGDKDLDLIVVSGGNEFQNQSPNYQDRLYINDGKGNFKKVQNGMPSILASGSCMALNDIDNDGDLDIFVGGRVSPGQYPTAAMSYIARNDGGKFTNVTPEWSEGLFKLGMITSAVFEDIDNDKIKELIIVGEWMPITIYKWKNGKYINVSQELGTNNTLGWWETLHILDLNNDGFKDIVAGNIGLNSYFKASIEKPLTLHYKDYDGNSTLDPILCYFNGEKSYPFVMRDKLLDHMVILKKKFLRYKDYSNATISDIFTPAQRKDETILKATNLASMVFYNQKGKSFLAKELPQTAQTSCIRSIIDYDIDSDGKTDLITAGNFYGTDVFLGRYDSSIGNVLMNDGNDQLKNLPTAYSGFKAKGDVRRLLKIKSKSSTNIMVIKNNDLPEMIKIKSKTKDVQ